ncbi:hypothetical protein MesoLj113a_62120 [Mesorhizobium sp. 113-1-2]|uniref:hypothetical protein n=1 Tax=Mesorhizobium sp. 113-1-2 TaxID=2744515 RepID=UPI001928FAFE|nr:hypothetical protein [Mesorhizobium sp. 113-1-2]BCG75054.1 hypothetical protein MesoLj113a_62120 [Mesorhizobium sp. 113-1-2]
MPVNVPERNVSNQLGKIAGQIVAGDVAIEAADADQLTDLVRFAEGLHKAAGFSGLLRHIRK